MVRGAPLIGATAAYGVALAMREGASDEALDTAHRSPAANAAHRNQSAMGAHAHARSLAQPAAREARGARLDVRRAPSATKMSRPAAKSANTVSKSCARLAAKKGGKTLNILTHCNAGWLGCVDWGTALAPIYMAHDAGIPLHVWVDETRPRNQGASLTAFELGGHGVPHTIIADNAGGHYMQRARSGPLHRRLRPRDGQWRRGQQDRHLSEGAGRQGQQRAVLCGAAQHHLRPDARQRRRHSHRATRRGRDHRNVAGEPKTAALLP